jgi:hypothetical protein
MLVKHKKTKRIYAVKQSRQDIKDGVVRARKYRDILHPNDPNRINYHHKTLIQKVPEPLHYFDIIDIKK